MNKLLLFLIGAAMVASSTNAAIFTQWNFNSKQKDYNTATGSVEPSIGSALTSTMSRIGGVGYLFYNGSPNDPAADNDDSSFRINRFPQAANQTAGLQFRVSTLGWQNISISWDQSSSASSSGYARLQYTLDVTAPTPAWVDSDLFRSTTTIWTSRTADLSGVAGANNNVNFGFRIVSEYGTPNNYVGTTQGYDANGTWSFDLMTLSGIEAVPEPATWAWGAGLCALVICISREGSRCWGWWTRRSA